MSDQQHLIYGELQQADTRYVYFLLAISATSIAFGLTQTNDAALSLTQIPLGLAVLFWAFSFFAGCRSRYFNIRVLSTNMEIIQNEEGVHELSKGNHGMQAVGRDFLKEKIDKFRENDTSYGNSQFWFYVFGAILFISWHVLEMYCRLNQ